MMKQCFIKHARQLLTAALSTALLATGLSVGGLAKTVDKWGDNHEIYEERLYGDINLDYKVNSTDYAMLKRAVLGTYVIAPNTDTWVAADINKNGKLDTADYMLLKRSVLGTFPPLGLIIEELRPNPYASMTDEELYAKIDAMLAADPNPKGANILAISFQRIKRETQGAALLGSLGLPDDFADPAYLDVGHTTGMYLWIVIEVPSEQLRETIFKLWRCDEISDCMIHGDTVEYPA